MSRHTPSKFEVFHFVFFFFFLLGTGLQVGAGDGSRGHGDGLGGQPESQPRLAHLGFPADGECHRKGCL